MADTVPIAGLSRCDTPGLPPLSALRIRGGAVAMTNHKRCVRAIRGEYCPNRSPHKIFRATAFKKKSRFNAFTLNPTSPASAWMCDCGAEARIIAIHLPGERVDVAMRYLCPLPTDR